MKKLTGRRLQIAAGEAGIPLDKVAAYRQRWASQGYELPEVHMPLPKNLEPIDYEKGPGTALKKMLHIVGLKSSATCGCEKKAKAMNEAGSEWCQYNIEKIVTWLEDSAKSRKLPFSHKLARKAIQKAIDKSRREEELPPEHPLPKGVTKWAVGITTAPRPNSVLSRTVRSLRSAGFEPTLYCEPGTLTGDLPYDVRCVFREERLGCWRNYVQTMRDLLRENPDADAYMICQDDIVVSPYLRRFLERDLWPSAAVGSVSIYTPHYPHYEGDSHPGSVNIVRVTHNNLMGACGLIYTRESIKKILEHPLSNDWRGCVDPNSVQQNPALKKATDTWVGHVTNRLGLANYYYVPSFSQHIAETSAIGHGGNSQKTHSRGKMYSYRRSNLFRGEGVSAGEIWKNNFYWGRWTLPQGHLRFAEQPFTKTTRKICPVIPARGLPDVTVNCLRHLERSSIAKDIHPVYVEDGPEPDWNQPLYKEIMQTIHRMNGYIHVLDSPEGYTNATNAGIRFAKEIQPSSHILLLNNDCYVGPRCLENMRWHLERHGKAAAVGPLTGDHGRQSVKNDYIATAARIRDRGLSAEAGDKAAYRKMVWEFDKLSGFCMMLHSDALKELGPLAIEGYPLGLGTDDEWIRRANRSGWRTFLAFDAWAVHDHNKTFRATNQMVDRQRASQEASRTLRST